MDIMDSEFADVGEPELPGTLDMDIDITFQKKRFTSLHLEEPTAKQLEKAELELNVRDPTAYMFRRYQIALIAAVAKVPREVVLELRNSQLKEAFDFLERILRVTPKDGET
jgi:hypothetical protein